MTYQRSWALKQKAKGHCVGCGRLRGSTGTASRCRRCADLWNTYQRKKDTSKHKGGRRLGSIPTNKGYTRSAWRRKIEDRDWLERRQSFDLFLYQQRHRVEKSLEDLTTRLQLERNDHMNYWQVRDETILEVRT